MERDIFKIDPKRGLFTKIEFPDLDLIVPFVCRKSGRRCKTYTPYIPDNHLIIIARDLHRNEDELLKTYRERYLSKLTTHPQPCPFQRHDNLCAIYEHPLRPRVCWLYPFSFQGGDMECPGYVEHVSVRDMLIENEKGVVFYDASFCPDLSLRPIPEWRWKQFKKRIIKAHPCWEMVIKFLMWNEERVCTASEYSDSKTRAVCT
ncbi:MAG: YkgJ family cysteine cluster protein [Syntrophales bacterium]|nr:YkgJ family cysteine cluster protein [Syntrophales bacterium]